MVGGERGEGGKGKPHLYAVDVDIEFPEDVDGETVENTRAFS